MSFAFLRRISLAVLGCIFPAVAGAVDNIEWVSINLPASGGAGTILQFSAVVKNTGDTTWDGNCYLELADSAGNHLYYPSVAGVAPGQTVSRMFLLYLPGATGNATYTFKGMRHNIAYFGPTQSRTINVQPGPANQGVILTGTQEAGGVYLLDPAAMPVISSADSLGVPYRLRAKVIDGTQYGWHAANVWNTNPFVLDNPMAVPGSYPVTALYWIKYDPQWGTLMEIGQERFVPVRVPGGVVRLSSYAFGQLTPPTISTTEPFTATYWLYAKFKNSSGQEWDATPRPANAPVNSHNNNTTLAMSDLPPVGQYSLEMTWKRFDAAGNVVGTGPTFAEPVVVIYPGGGQVLSVTDTIDWEPDGNGGGEYSVKHHTFEAKIAGTVEINVSGSFAITTAVDRLNPNGEEEWVAGGGANFSFGVAAGQVFRLRVSSSDGTGPYQATGMLTAAVSPPSFATSSLVVTGTVNTALVQFVGAAGSGTVTHTAVNLPGWLTLTADGHLIGTPPAAGAWTFQVIATNASGSAMRTITLTVVMAGGQTITFGNLPDKVTNSPPFTISATASSGLPVSFSVVSGPATTSGSTVTLTGFMGSVTIRASQGGNANYAPAAPVDRSFIVSMAPGGPMITTQPQGASIVIGTNATLSVAATGNPTLSYQWRREGVAMVPGDGIPSVTNPTLTISGFTGYHVGNYTVSVSNSLGAATSNVATLSLVNGPGGPPGPGGGGGGGGLPNITSLPVSKIVAVGSPVSLAVTVQSGTPVTYQWKKDGVNLANGGTLSGATTATLSISSFQPSDTGSYTVTITNAAGSVTTLPASLAMMCGIPGSNARLPSGGNRSPYVPGLISSTVGGSGYDIQSGSILRSVRDFSVTGSVGAYPLEMRRVYVAENKSLSGSGWAHSFIWFANENVDSYWPLTAGVQNLYVYTPDGQYLHFRFTGDDAPNEFYQNGHVRVQATRDANKRIDNVTLCFADGGILTMAKYKDVAGLREFRASTLTDPFGLVTTFSYASGTTALPQQVTDSSGRWLKFFGPNVQEIARVESSDGKWININGANGVSYWDGTSATYTRTELPGGYLPLGDGTIVMRFTDVRQTSAMRDVEYVVKKVHYGPYSPSGPDNWGDDPYGWEVLTERHPTGAPGTGTVVSTRTVQARQQFVDGIGVLNNGPAIRATETRGDGATRAFTFGGGAYRMTSATDFRGNRWEFSGYLGTVPSNVRDPLGHFTYFVSNSYEQIEKVTYPDGNFRDYVWTGSYLTSEKDERGYITHYDRDAQQRVWRIRHPDTTQETYTYNARNQVTSHVLRSGATEHWTYNASALKTAYWPPTTLGAVPGAPNFTYAYYGAGHASQDLVQTETDPRGNATTYTYNSRNQITLETLPGGATRAASFDTQGNRLWADNELGQRTIFTYDAYNRLLTTTNPLGHVTTHSYEPTAGGSSLVHTAAAIRRTTTPLGRIVANRYDADYRVIETIRAEGTADAASVSMTYDAAGRMTQRADQVDAGTTRVTTYAYDSRNRKTEENAPLGRTTRWEYDAASNVLKVINPDATFTTKAYDSMNRVSSSTDERGHTTGFSYHASGKLNVITDPRGNPYTHAYNSRELLTSRTYPGGSAESWEFDAAGNRSAYINRSSQRLDYTHDARNRETQRTWVGAVAPAVSTGYDNASRVTSRSNTHSAVTYGYDSAGRMNASSQTVTGRPAVSFTYGHDNDGARTSFSASSGQSLGYGYNSRGALTSVTQGGGTLASYVLNKLDQRTTRTAANGTISAYGYDGAGRLNALNTYLGTPASAIFAQRFGHDLRDRRTWTLRDENLGDTYEYFADSQLQRYRHAVSRPDQNFNNPAGWTDTFAYDAAGNRTSLDENGTVTSYTADALNQYSSVTGATVAHDGRGNLTQWNGWAYAFDAENRLLTATQGGVTHTFSHDPEGRLVKIDRAGVAEFRYYDGSQCFLRTDAAGTQIDWTVWGPSPDEALARQVAGGAWQYHHHDPLNSTVAVTDAAGAVLERYLYDPFGEPDVRDASWAARPAGTAIGNPWLFTGQEWRGEMMLSNYKARWHHPRLGRFLQTDPIRFDAGDLNLYRYVGNNPINSSDPTGHFERFESEPVRLLGHTIQPPPMIADRNGRIVHGGEFNYVETAFLNAANGVGNSRDAAVLREMSGSGFGDMISAGAQYPKEVSAHLAGMVAGGFRSPGNPFAGGGASGRPPPSVGVADAGQFANPRNLVSRQGPTEMTGNKVKRYAADMKKNGFDPAHPIEVANVEGKQIIINGHHRAAAAERAGITQVPITTTPVDAQRAAQLAAEAADAAAQRSFYRR